jgi:hypothetical protein
VNGDQVLRAEKHVELRRLNTVTGDHMRQEPDQEGDVRIDIDLWPLREVEAIFNSKRWKIKERGHGRK